MNKKMILALLTAFALVFAAGAVLVACSNRHPAEGGASSAAPETDGTAETTEAATGTNGDNTEGTTEPAGNTGGNTPVIEIGVTGREEVDDTQPQTPTQPAVTEPDESKPDTDVPAPLPADPTQLTLAEFEAMSGEEQDKFIESFPSLKAFNAWYNGEKAKEPTRETINMEGGSIDLGDLIP